jgi:hypothetical protein
MSRKYDDRPKVLTNGLLEHELKHAKELVDAIDRYLRPALAMAQSGERDAVAPAADFEDTLERARAFTGCLRTQMDRTRCLLAPFLPMNVARYEELPTPGVLAAWSDRRH